MITRTNFNTIKNPILFSFDIKYDLIDQYGFVNKNKLILIIQELGFEVNLKERDNVGRITLYINNLGEFKTDLHSLSWVEIILEELLLFKRKNIYSFL